MKFSNGFWLMRDGVRAMYPEQARDVSAGPDSLTVYAPTRRISGRGDTLDTPVITVTCTSPMPDVIAVTVTHLAGQRPKTPEFPLNVDPTTEVSVDPDAATLSAGRLSVRFRQGDDWGLEFLAGDRVLTGSGWRGMAVIDTDSGEHYVREQLDLDVDEAVYGLGERFGPVVKNGQEIDIWNADGGTASDQAYKNVPFYLTNRGYGVLVDHPGRVSFEVASEVVSRVQFSVAGQSLRYLLIYGPTPKDVLRRYTALTGRPALPPAWSFGLWLSTSFTTSYDEQTVTAMVDGMARRDIPLSVFHFDSFWMREFNWCDFCWDSRVFPDPPGMLKRLKDRGLRICVWINPYIAQRSPLFAEGMAAGYLLRRPGGDVWQTDKWQAGMALVDFTNPAARSWYGDKLRGLLDMGVDSFKSDFGERVPTDVEYFDGSDPERMHNFYSYLYNRTVFEVLREYRGAGEAVVFARSATVGGQQFPVHWGGDNASTFPSMAESLRGGLSLAMSGFGFWSHDIGGFEGVPDEALFKRWVPFGLLSSHSRLHGNEAYKVPWLFGEEAVHVLRRFTRLKASLMPYLYRAAITAHEQGVPVMRPMVLQYPDDPTCVHLERQYMLGDDLLVAPVFTADGRVEYYVPAGAWTHYLTGQVVEGPGWRRETHAFDSIPLLVRPGAVIPVGAVDDRSDYPYAEGVTLRVYRFAAGDRAAVSVPTPSGGVGAEFEVTRDGCVLRAERTVTGCPPAAAWQLLLVGVDAADVEAVDGGSVRQTADGALIEVDPATNSCVLTLPS